MSLLANSNAIEDAGYNIQRSLRFRSSASAYLSRTPASAGNRTTWTFSAWVKRGNFSSSSSIGIIEGNAGTTDLTAFRFVSDVLSVQDYSSSSGYNLSWVTTAVFRDPSAWYHIILVYDTTQVSSANAVKIYVNSVQQTVTFTAVTGSYVQNRNSYINATNAQRIGVYNGLANYFDGYLAEVNFIDGQALTPSSFGQTDAVTGVWQPKKYTGTYGTNGFYLPFSDNTSATTLAYDKSGNGNNWTPNNISTTAGATYDSMTDVPTLTDTNKSNYCVLNPSKNQGNTLGNGNLNIISTTTSNTTIVFGTIGMPSGKWYWEYTQLSMTVISNASMVGIAKDNATLSAYVGYDTNGWGYYGDGNKYTNNTSSAYGAGYTNNDVIGVAFDADAGTLVFYKNGVSQGTAFSGLTSGPYFPAFSDGGSTTVMTAVVNFGQRPFSYTPPTGFKALNTFNLPDPTIKKPNQYMDVRTWSGTTSFPYSPVTDLAFQPDLVWAKARSTTYDHVIYDSVRGTGTTKMLASNNTSAEGYAPTNADLSSFNATGFTVQATSGANVFAQNGQTFVGWQWKESATAGFDIVTYTGTGSARTVSHSLGVAPKLIIIKNRSAVTDWRVWSQASGNGSLYLNTTASFTASAWAGDWNSTAPTSTLFSVGTNSSTNAQNYVAYLFAEIAGFSKFGSYTGNGSADGPFLNLGFLPKYFLFKRTDTAADWQVWDSSRDTYNIVGKVLYPNTSGAEAGSQAAFDMVSNGIKFRNAGVGNNSGGTYIFAAFAETPFRFALAR